MESVDVVGSTWIDIDGVEVKVKNVDAYIVYFDWLNNPLFDSGIVNDRMSITGFEARFKRKPSSAKTVKFNIGAGELPPEVNWEDHCAAIAMIDDAPPKAVQILTEAVEVMAERGKSYDKSGGQAERSMPKIVAMFNALTGHELTPEQGWKFMCCLKLARSEQGEYREDNYLDGAAYFALAGEEAGESAK